jgi:phage protein D
MTDFFPGVAPVFKVDGQVARDLARDIESLEVVESTDGMKTLAFTLVARGPGSDPQAEETLYLDGRVVDFGKELEVSIGAAEEACIVFKGLVSAIEGRFGQGGEPRVNVFAEDGLMALRMTRRMRTYEQTTDADIARTLAGEHGLSADVDADGPTYSVVQQWNQSDLAFLRERARGVQAEIWLDGARLCFKSRGKRDATSLELTQGGDLLAVQLRADLAHQRTQVRISGYDATARDVIDEEAGEEAVLSEVSGGRIGPAVVQSAFGQRVSHRVRENPLTAPEARDWARAEMLRRARSFVTVSGVTSGSPAMVVGSKLTLNEVGKAFEGDGYTVTRVCHTYDLSHGHRTHFEAERATVNAS